jgi:transposase
LVAQGWTIAQLVKVFLVTHKTLYNWLDAWEKRGITGLYNQPGRGRKALFNREQREQIKAWAKENPKNLNGILQKIEESWGMKVSKDTIKRILKVLGMSWRRVRKGVGGQPNPLEYEVKKELLEELKKQDDEGKIDLRYLDESGFCLVPCVPYAWQDKGETLELESGGGKKRLNVLGIMNRQNNLEVHTFECPINSDVVVACIDNFCEAREERGEEKKAVIVMDQASIHTSEQIVYEKQEEWQERGVELFWLPTYSPELNLIEILWRFIKYEWIEISAYKSWTSLVEYVERVLSKFGEEFVINFA